MIEDHIGVEIFWDVRNDHGTVGEVFVLGILSALYFQKSVTEPVLSELFLNPLDILLRAKGKLDGRGLLTEIVGAQRLMVCHIQEIYVFADVLPQELMQIG